MDISEFEKRVLRLVNRGIISKSVSVAVVNSFVDNADRREKIAESLEKAEKLNDEDGEFFIKLNQIINGML